MKDVVIYGFGGFGREIASILKQINRDKPTWNLLGFIDDGYTVGESNRYGEILGGMDFLNSYQSDLSVIMAIGSSLVVKKLVCEIRNEKIVFPNIIAPSVHFYDRESLILGCGNIVTVGSRISCDVNLGDFNILNSGCCLGHDVRIGNYNLLEPETRLSGGTLVGDNNFFGTRCVILQYVKIGDNTRIGACSLIIRNTKSGYLYMGNPAKRIEGV